MRGSATTKARHVILNFDIISEITTFEENGGFGKENGNIGKYKRRCIYENRDRYRWSNIRL